MTRQPTLLPRPASRSCAHGPCARTRHQICAHARAVTIGSMDEKRDTRFAMGTTRTVHTECKAGSARSEQPSTSGTVVCSRPMCLALAAILIAVTVACATCVYLFAGYGADGRGSSDPTDGASEEQPCAAGIAMRIQNPRTAFFTGPVRKTASLSLARLASGEYPPIATSCAIVSRHTNGASVPVEDSLWTCSVECLGATCAITTAGTPPAPGLYTLSMTVARLGCEPPLDGRGTGALDVLVPNPAQQTDLDGDGTVDMADWCPADPQKTSPGTCGCGESDADANDDGVPDCRQPTPDESGSPFVTPLVATPPIVTQGHIVALSVTVRDGWQGPVAWSVPVGWTRVPKSPSDAPTALLLRAPDDVGDTRVICVSAVEDGDTMWHACTRVAVAASTNSPPSTPVVAVSADAVSNDVTCRITTASVDPDGDEVTYRTHWLLNGCETEHESKVVPRGAVTPGDVWTCHVVATDGDMESLPATAAAFVPQRWVFGFIGEWQAIQVPRGATTAVVKLLGGGGGGGAGVSIPQNGGPGGYASGTFSVSAGDVLRVAVGAGGGMNDRSVSQAWPDGGINWVRSQTNNGYFSGGGGGRSEVMLNGETMVIAGAGGGAGASGGICGGAMHGGGGGGSVGGDGSHCVHNPHTYPPDGRGGSQSEGGLGGSGNGYCPSGPATALAGGPKRGGSGLAQSNVPVSWSGGGGGGGGGWYGGGCGSCHAGGGGGSSYVNVARVRDSSVLRAESGPALANLLPPAVSDPDYTSPAGVAGNGCAGRAGRVVVRFQ